MSARKTVNLLLILAFASVLAAGFRMIDQPKAYQFSGLSFFPKMPPTENPPTVEGAELGRFLFYDPVLSADSSLSCASCHRREAAFSDAPNRFSRGINGSEMKRNTLPLFNLAWYPELFWDGRAKSIEDQVSHPVKAHDEMNLDWTTATLRISENDFYKAKFRTAFGNVAIDSSLIVKAIAQFERTLISNQSKYDRVLRGEDYFSADEYEGFVLMNDQGKGDCLHCHTTDSDALGTTGGLSNNGLEDAYRPEEYSDRGKETVTGKPSDIGKFKIPSLRNVALTPPYMHDGRFASLEEVLDFYSEGVNRSYNIDSKMQFAHRGGVGLNEDEKKKIIAFLHTLTDSVFISNPAFGNPFVGRK